MSEKKFISDLVSVIIPVYNAERFIAQCIDSVLNQTYKNLEIVLVDDCSTDNSKNIITSYEDNRIIYFRQEKNLGAGIARNKALELAKGQYVAFLDSDDIWEKDKLEKQVSLLKDKNSYFTYSGASLIDENGCKLNKIRKVKTEFSYKKLLKNTMIITSSVLIDRNIVKDFKMSEIRSGQDYATWLSLLRNREKIYGINEPLCRYRIVSGSLSSSKIKSIKQVYNIQRKQEKINVFSSMYHTLCFIIHAFIKHFL